MWLCQDGAGQVPADEALDKALEVWIWKPTQMRLCGRGSSWLW